MPSVYLLRTTKPWTNVETGLTEKAGAYISLPYDRAKIVLDAGVCEPVMASLSDDYGEQKRVIIALSVFEEVGGIETSVRNLVENFPNRVTIVAERMPSDWFLRLAEFAEVVIDLKHKMRLTCETLILVQYDCSRWIDYIDAQHIYQQIHADFRQINIGGGDKFLKHPRIEKYLAVSETAKAGLKEKYGLDSVVVPNCVAIKTTHPMLFGYFGRATSEKGIPALVNFIDLVNCSEYDAQFVIAAKNLRMYYRAYYDKLERTPNVILLEASPSAVAWRRACDYIIQLSDSETTCESVKEALGEKIPVIVSKIPAFEYVQDGVHGYHLDARVTNEDLRKIFTEKPVITDREWCRKTDKKLWNRVLGGKM